MKPVINGITEHTGGLGVLDWFDFFMNHLLVAILPDTLAGYQMVPSVKHSAVLIQGAEVRLTRFFS